MVLDNLELRPYQYEEDLDYDKSLRITARILLSEEQYSELGKLPRIVKVIRKGIDNDQREMELIEFAWSKSNNEIKEKIGLYDKKEKRRLPMAVWSNNLMKLVAEQHLMIEGLLTILASDGVLEEGKINEIKKNITEERIWEKRRELNHLNADLDEYEM